MYKINRFHLYILLAAAVFAEVVILPHVKIGGAKPELVLICAAFCGMFLGPYAGLEAGIMAGFLRDIFTLDILWINAFVFGVAGFLSGTVSSKFYRESRSTQFFFMFGLTLFSMCLHYIVSAIFLKSPNLLFATFFFATAMPSALYTALLTIPVFKKLLDVFNLRDYRDSL